MDQLGGDTVYVAADDEPADSDSDSASGSDYASASVVLDDDLAPADLAPAYSPPSPPRQHVRIELDYSSSEDEAYTRTRELPPLSIHRSCVRSKTRPSSSCSSKPRVSAS